MRIIGVSIPIPEPHGEWLRAKRASYGDELARTVPTHLTLIPPTRVAQATLGDIEFALAEVATAMTPFEMRLHGTGSFRPVSPVVFVAVAEGIAYTEVLAQAIRGSFDFVEPEHPFHPHVTVAQNVDDASLDQAATELADFTAEFVVDAFSLYLHEEGPGWLPTRSFPLGVPFT